MTLALTLADFPLWFLRGFAVLFGLLWGSFLNVVIYRVPRGQSVVSPASRCTSCDTPIRPWNNLPVVSWVLLRGRSACCGKPISPRYVAVELIGGVLSLAVLELLILPLSQPTTSIERAGAIYVTSFALSLFLVSTAFVDLEHLVILPDRANVVAAVLGVGTASLRGGTYLDMLIGGAAGLALGFVINSVYRMLRGRSGFASGDSILLGVVGSWFGWQGALFGLFAGALQGTVIFILVSLLGGKIEEPEEVKKEREEILAEIQALPEEEREAALAEWRKEDELADASGDGMQAPLAFGPFIALSGLELLLFGETLRDAFIAWTAA
jgi:leader peptidase (prepilin peptidase)/N-methyltransferase